MSRINQIETERLRKLGEIRKAGIDPFPYSFERNSNISELRVFEGKKLPKKEFRVAGRIKTQRNLGKIAFLNLEDENSSIQIVFRKGESKDVSILKFLDVGDFLGVTGTLITTKTGELSLLVNKAQLLTKSLLPLPDKWHGLRDQELKYRKRYLQLVSEPQVREVFRLRSQIIWEMRKFLVEQGFIETETPILQPIYGGANARPFITHLNAKDAKTYLRISDELYLKRLIIGGFEKVFEIGKDFRNESIDTTHNPEFTMMECYWAYVDYSSMMKLTEDMVSYIVKNATGGYVVEYQGNKLNFKPPWKRLPMIKALKEIGGVDIEKMKDSEVKKLLEKYNIELEGGYNRGWAIAELFDELVEDKIIQPTFIIDMPRETTSLCKLHRKDERLIERFEPFVAGMEIGNAYSELNDPILQDEFFKAEAKREKAGVDDAHKYDADFIEALKYGMPPTGGLGIGVDRIVMLLANTPSLRDVILFPIVK